MKTGKMPVFCDKIFENIYSQIIQTTLFDQSFFKK